VHDLKGKVKEKVATLISQPKGRMRSLAEESKRKSATSRRFFEK
jgi:hypothetical protein